MRPGMGDIRTAPVPPGPSGVNVLPLLGVDWCAILWRHTVRSGANTGTRCECR